MRHKLGFAGLLLLALCVGLGEGKAQIVVTNQSGRSSAALTNIGGMYEKGNGVPVDFPKAYALYHLAASLPNSDSGLIARASQSRDLLALKMSSAQLAQAQELLAQCYGSDINLCGERILSGGGIAAAKLNQPARRSDKTIVPLENFHGIYVVPGVVNGAIKLKFAVDTGAADVAIPADIVSSMVKDGTITKADFLGEQTYILANGSSMPSQTFLIHSLQVGDVVIEDVKASVTPENGAMLLGLSFFRKLKSWSLDSTHHTLVIE